MMDSPNTWLEYLEPGHWHGPVAAVAIALIGGVLVLDECGVSVAPILGAAGIEIPFPHLTVYAGIGKDGQAPPFGVTPRLS